MDTDIAVPDGPSLRCPLCRARGLQPSARSLRFETRTRRYSHACGHCGLLFADPALRHPMFRDPARAEAFFSALCARQPAMPRVDDPFGCDMYTMRTLATRFGLAATPADAAQAQDLAAPHGLNAARADLGPLDTMAPSRVSVGILCSEGEAEAVLASADRHRSWAEAVVVIVDRAGETGALERERNDGFVRVVSHPLRGHFADQRNRLQALCPSPWMFQLDADEEISADLGETLVRLATLADRQGAVSVGLPRENRVEGALSDLYPDVQYRLNRREVLYEGTVHERPARPWQRSFIALSGAIRHNLTAGHVARRSRAYEALKPGGGRLFEEQALSRPFSDL